MSIFRVEKQKNYTVMSNVHLQDKNLSLKAKGLLSQILSLPDDWNFTLRGLASQNKESVNTISNVVNELIEAGYIVREQCRADTGHFGEASYVIYEIPPNRLESMSQTIIWKLNQESTPCHKNCDTVDNAKSQESAVLKEITEEKEEAPCHRNCDTVDNNVTPPCHKKPYTVNCDSNKILNKQNTNIYKYPSIPSRNNTCNAVVPTVGTTEGSEPKEKSTIKHFSYEKYEEIIKSNISYDDLLKIDPENTEVIDGIVEIMLDILISKKTSIRIAGEQKPIGLVKAKFMKLQMEDIEYLLWCLSNNTTKIRDTKAYMISCLYNAKETRIIHYRNNYQYAANRDMNGRQEGTGDTGG